MLTLYIADVERDVGMKKLSQEEAVKVLEDMKVKIEIPKAAVTQWKRNTALDMAIKALEQLEQRLFSCGQENDMISRQAALEIMAKWLNDVCGMREIEGVKLTPLKQLRELPSVQQQELPVAQPERKTGKAIVKSTGYRGYVACYQCGTEIESTDDFCRHCGADLRG